MDQQMHEVGARDPAVDQLGELARASDLLARYLDEDSLPYPLERGPLQLDARTRVLEREYDDVPEASPAPSQRVWKADPSKLPTDKKSRYHGVRCGRNTGIYYSWEEAEEQTRGYPDRISQTFKTPEDVEWYMNHEPEDCTFKSCRDSCKAESERKRYIDLQKVDEMVGSCECCNNGGFEGPKLCGTCWSTPRVWFNKLVKKHGLVKEQSDVLQQVFIGRNVFFSGSAGTGKSRLLRAITEYLVGMELVTEVVAPTSLAVANTGGKTLRSLFQSYVGWYHDVDTASLDDLMDRAYKSKAGSCHIPTEALVIDEVSMMDSNTLTRLHVIMQAAAKARGSANFTWPFGGAQIIFCADFYQIPPPTAFVYCLWCGQTTSEGEHENIRICDKHGKYNLHDQFAFSSPVWDKCLFAAVELKHQHRQTDPELMECLESERLIQSTSAARMSEVRDTIWSNPCTFDPTATTQLSSLRTTALKSNKHHMDALSTEPVRYTARDSFIWDSQRHPMLEGYEKRDGGEKGSLVALKDHHLDYRLEMKQGMLVILLADLDASQDLVAGRSGTVVGFERMCTENMPDVVAASLIQNRNRVGPTAQYQQEQVEKFCGALPGESQAWPKVRFSNDCERLVPATCLIQELGSERLFSLLSRTQIPLITGYALSVFQAQGLTLDKVIADLGGFVGHGQWYVALSRVRTLDDIWVKTEAREKERLRAVNRAMAKMSGHVYRYDRTRNDEDTEMVDD